MYSNIYLTIDFWRKRIPMDFAPCFEDMRLKYVDYAKVVTPQDEILNRRYTSYYNLVMQELINSNNNIQQ